jgi:hypothetical protein
MLLPSPLNACLLQLFLNLNHLGDLMHEHDPWIYVGFHQRELERITKLLMNIMCEIRRLKEAGILNPDEFILFRSRLKEKLHRLEAVSDEEVDRMLQHETERSD